MQTTPKTDRTEDRLTVYFDGSCPLCTAEINHYKRQQGAERLHFVDVSQEGSNPGPDLSPRDAMRRFHVRQSDGALVSGARGFIAIWQVLPRWRWAARLGSIPGMASVMEFGYRIFLPVRPLLSKFASRLGAQPANQCACRR